MTQSPVKSRKWAKSIIYQNDKACSLIVCPEYHKLGGWNHTQTTLASNIYLVKTTARRTIKRMVKQTLRHDLHPTLVKK